MVISTPVALNSLTSVRFKFRSSEFGIQTFECEARSRAKQSRAQANVQTNERRNEAKPHYAALFDARCNSNRMNRSHSLARVLNVAQIGFRCEGRASFAHFFYYVFQVRAFAPLPSPCIASGLGFTGWIEFAHVIQRNPRRELRSETPLLFISPRSPTN